MKLRSILVRMLAAPVMPVLAAMEDVDIEELQRAVEKRTARAEAAVLRDYSAQHGLSSEESEQLSAELRLRRQEAAEDSETLKALRERAEQAEKSAQKAKTSAEALVQMARMGVPESCTEDVLLLTAAQLEKSENKDSEAVKEAVSAVIARLPGLGQPLSSGSRGSFPRKDDGAATWQYQLDVARASGNNAAAVGIITAAAQNGISLR